MDKQAAIYVRVDTSKQVDCRHSLQSQIENCKKLAEQKGFTVVGIYQDQISGAKPMLSRPAGSQLQRTINKGLINVVIVYRVDRLSRNIVDFLAIVEIWSRAGVEIYALHTGQVASQLSAEVKVLQIKR